MINVDPTDASKIKVLIHSQFFLIILLKIPISFTFGKFSQSFWGHIDRSVLPNSFTSSGMFLILAVDKKLQPPHYQLGSQREMGRFILLHIILFPF